MNYKALDLFPLCHDLTACEVYQRMQTYNTPDTLIKKNVRRYTNANKIPIVELTAYEIHNKHTDYEYYDKWLIRIIIKPNYLLIETIYPKEFAFNILDEHNEQQEQTKERIVHSLKERLI